MEPTKGLSSAFDSETFGRDGSFHIDKPVGSASISPCGRDVVLASQEGIHIIDLDSPYAPPRNLTYKTPWEVADVQWSPFAVRDHWIVSTSNQKALVWNIGLPSRQSSVEFVLHGHTRAITDINFSAHHPDILATCAVDSYVHCWDLRRPLKPGMTFCDWFAGATQVKWNRQAPHILASSHDKFLRIWDDRWGAQPLRSIKAHSTKIYGVDWDRLDTRQVATCGLDNSIKLWRFDEEHDIPSKTITTPFPVWRARHTPFGNGLLALPQRGDQNLHLYDRSLESEGLPDGMTPPVHQFTGHRDLVKEFLWRPRGTVTASVDDREFQLVSWGNDKLLRLHEVDDVILDKVGYTRGMEVNRTINFTRKGAQYRSFRQQPEHYYDNDVHQSYQAGRSALTSALKKSTGPVATGFGATGFRSATNPKRVTAKETDPVSWMKGVRIGKRAASPTGEGQGPLSSMPSSPKLAPEWETFDSLGEEITSALDKFPNIGVIEVDVQRRTLTISFSGPWASNRRATKLTCRLDFPSLYPNDSAPMFSLDNAPKVEDETIRLICAEVSDLSAAFAREGRHCLEDILRYLQGEQTLDEGRRRLERPSIAAVSGIGLMIESSSDEEDDGLEINTGKPLGESDPMITVNNARYNVPLPNTCGVRWGPSGPLVCFFPPRQEKGVLSLGRNLDIDFLANYNSRDIFEGFGRFRKTFRPRGSASTVAFEGASDEDDFEISSDSSSSSTNLALLNHHFLPALSGAGFNSALLGGKNLDASQKSVDGIAQGEDASTGTLKASTIVITRDLKDLLPMKVDLARDLLQGPGCTAATYNAGVAENFGNNILAELWHLCGILTASLQPISSARERRTSSLATGRISSLLPNVALSPSQFGGSQQAIMKAGLEDSSHIKTRRWIIHALISHPYFAANAQVLATLVNVLNLRLPNAHISREPSDDETLVRDQASQATVQFPPKQPERQGEKLQPSQFPWKEELEKYFGARHSRKDSFDAPKGPLQRTLSHVMTLPGAKAFQGIQHKDLHPEATISTSPEDPGGLRRSNSTINNFPTTFANSSHSSAATSSSPPGNPLKKRLSQTGSTPLPGQPGSDVSPPTVSQIESVSPHSKISHIPPPQARRLSDKPTDVERRKPTKKGFTLKLKNQHRFQQTSVLDAGPAEKFDSWNRAYAYQLAAWSLPISAAEVLKKNEDVKHRVRENASRPMNPGLNSLSNEPPRNNGPAFYRTCPKCGAVQTKWRVQSCGTCNEPQHPIACSYCTKAINGGHSPCLRCKHTVHLHCRIDMAKHGIESCASGCGCLCSDHESVGMPMPAKDSMQHVLRPRGPSRLRGVSPAITVVEYQEKRPYDEEQQQQQAPHDDAAYLSLTKTLEKRRRESSLGLRATASQIWRGGQ